MPHANHYFLPSHVWHINHRCHKKEFLLKYAKDQNVGCAGCLMPGNDLAFVFLITSLLRIITIYWFVTVVKVRLRTVCSWLPVVLPRNITSVKIEKVRSGKTAIMRPLSIQKCI